MTTKITPEKIAELRGLMSDATHGTYETDSVNGTVCVNDGDYGYDGIAEFNRQEDQDYWISAVNALPDLLDEVERLAIRLTAWNEKAGKA